MEALIYLGKVNLYWVIFYVCYRLFLHRHTFFVWNRTYLLVSLILAMVLPAIHLPEQTPIVVQSSAYIVDKLPSYSSIPSPDIIPPASSNIPWEQLVLIVIGLGIAFMTARLLHAFRRLFQVIKEGDVVPFEDHILVLLPHNEIGSFSFFKWLVINRNDYENNLDLILLHEMTHIRQMHSFDILFIEFLKMICWFNPALWLYKHSFQEVHEFLADEKAPNRERYATFLISYGLQAPIQSLTNHLFNSSLLKNRIAMIYKTRTSHWLLGKYAMIVPVILIIVLSTASNTRLNPISKTIKEKASLDAPSKVIITEEMPSDPKVKIKAATTNETFDINVVVVDELGKPVSRATLLSPNKAPLGKTDENGQFQIKGVEADSRISVSHVSFVTKRFVAKKTSDSYNLVLIRNKTMLEEVVVVAYGAATQPEVTKKSEANHPEPSVSVQKMPEFPGGEAEMYKYIAKKAHYPTEASRANIQGRVFIAFTVNEDGGIRNPRVVKGLGNGTDEEALRVVLNMPNWKPAEQDGEKVSADYEIAIKFALEKQLP